jgi:hypothetical protein
MMSNQHMKLAATLSIPAILLAADLVAAQTLADQLQGNWACVSGPCSDPEIQFALEDGRRVYNSWLHARPSASGGSWTLKGRKLTTECCAGIREEWEVLRADGTRLHLREAGSKHTAVFKRIKP